MALNPKTTRIIKAIIQIVKIIISLFSSGEDSKIEYIQDTKTNKELNGKLEKFVKERTFKNEENHS